MVQVRAEVLLCRFETLEIALAAAPLYLRMMVEMFLVGVWAVVQRHLALLDQLKIRS